MSFVANAAHGSFSLRVSAPDCRESSGKARAKDVAHSIVSGTSIVRSGSQMGYSQ